MTPSAGATILCVDDDSANRQSLAMLLGLEGFVVREAATGREGLHQARQRPDLILLDVRLPDVSGFEVCRAIKSNPATAAIPVIQLSGHFIRGEDRVHGLEGGADAYLTKPVEPRELIAHIKSLLRVHRAEQEAGRLARQWQTTFDAVQDGICLIDQSGKVVRCNQALALLLDRLPEQLEGRDYAELTHRAVQAPAPSSNDGAGSGQRQVSELCLGQRWFRVTLDPTLDEQGQVSGLVAVWAEITQRKHLEQALHRREQELRSLAEHVPDVVARFDSELRHVYINHRIAAATGLAPETFLGKTNRDLGLPEQLTTLWDDSTRQVFSDGQPRTFEFDVPTPDGVRHFETRLIPESAADGTVATVLGISRDITEQKQAEQTIRRLALIVESSDDAIIGKDPQGIITSWNAGATRMFGYSAEEMVGRPITVLLPLERLDEEQGILRRLGQGESVRQLETQRLRKDGRAIHVSLTMSPIRDAGGTVAGISTIARDITQRKVLEEQLTQAQKMEAIGHLAGGIAHDFNNLLTVINGFSEIMLGNIPRDDPSHHLLQEVRKAGDRAAGLTRQLLAFSRKQILQPRVVDLNLLVLDIQKMLGRMIGEDITLTTDLDPDLGRIKADPGQVEQVIVNLAVNARDAMPEGGKLTLSTRNTMLGPQEIEGLADVRPGSYTLLTVADTGHGMDRQTLGRIFEPFFTTKEIGKGTGLGLATAYGIVKQSGGHIEVESMVGVGTTFKVYLPRFEAEKESSKSNPALGTIPRGRETVLLVEDDEAVRQLTRRLLANQGYAVLEARDGPDALQIAERQPEQIDLLITDMIMPGMSGSQLARRLLALRPDLRVLYLSGYTDDVVLRHGIMHKDANFLHKPFSLAAFAIKVREVLDRKEEAATLPGDQAQG